MIAEEQHFELGERAPGVWSDSTPGITGSRKEQETPWLPAAAPRGGACGQAQRPPGGLPIRTES
jgi:hypothetical protein